MGEFFLRVLNMSLTATWIILTILILRRVFKKAPKWIFCVLWGFVAFRLTFVFESFLSLIPNGGAIQRVAHWDRSQYIVSDWRVINETVNKWWNRSTLQNTLRVSYETETVILSVLGHIWLVGMITMLLYTFICYMRLKRQVRTATILQDNVKQSEFVRSPFVLGFFKPMIYVPYHMDEADMKYVIIHERAHIQRRDQWWQTIGFVYLSVYWFNPLIWVAYILFCKDVEYACDEKVVRELSEEERRRYSTALLNCSIQRWNFSACPVAFGEVNVKNRVTNVMKFRKPTVRVLAISVVICTLVLLCLGTNLSSWAQNAQWGIRVTVDQVTPESVKGVLEYSETEKSEGIEHTYVSYLEKRTIWGWTRVDSEQIRYHNNSPNLMREEGKRYFYYHWENTLGALPNGIYRIRQPLENVTDDEVVVIGEYYIPFVILNFKTE